MKRPVFREYKTTEECVEAFERMLHLREEWEEKVRQREIELGIYNEAVCWKDQWDIALLGDSIGRNDAPF